jgi:hypothetical protein
MIGLPTMNAEKVKMKKDRSQDGVSIYRVSIWREYDHPKDHRIRWHKQEVGCVEKIRTGKWEARSDWGRVIGIYPAHRHAVLCLLEEFQWHPAQCRYVSNDEDFFTRQVNALRVPNVPDWLRETISNLTGGQRLGVEEVGECSIAELIALDPYD